MLTITNLQASVEDKKILNGINLEIPDGQVHVIMGPNGSGKTTLANVLAGRDGYNVSGKVEFNDIDLLTLTPEERATHGLFLAFQHPVEIPGVGNMYFLRTAVNSLRKSRGEEEISAVDFLKFAKEHMEKLDMDPSFLNRSVNTGFSGGEKKRNEMLQMSMLEPKLAILDETDSGLDIDAVRIVAEGIDRLRDPERSMMIITHHPKLLNIITPDKVHVLTLGRVIETGGPELAQEIEANGYGAILQKAMEKVTA